jgi:hypothetical protein
MARAHNKTEYLFPSQRKLMLRETEIKIDSRTKKTIDQLIIKATIIDGRSFLDFRKPGMMALFNQIVPGYMPPAR